MNDAEYYRRRAERARVQAARADGHVRQVHLDFAARYAERERLAQRVLGSTMPPAV